MELFDRFIKKKSKKGKVNADKATNASSKDKDSSVFRGDLARVFEYQVVRVTADIDSSEDAAANLDSTDSVIYLPLRNIPDSGWICRECETRNSDSLNGCIVCGLRR